LIGGTRYYYAHLDRWAIEGSTRVREGDVLGYVGNTGNARTTSPHLHFGVYDDDALDPAPFLQPDESVARLTVEPALFGSLVRTRSVRTPLRAGPSAAAPQRVLLEPETIAQRLGVAGSWHRVLMPDGAVGYVADNAVVSAGVPLRRQRATRPLGLREKPQLTAPLMMTLEQGAEVEVLGRFHEFDFIRAAQGQAGWNDARPQR
jgi:peptidoglycan LD-endopeptidase LytH